MLDPAPTPKHVCNQYCTIVCCAVLCCTVLYCAALYCIALYCIALYCILYTVYCILYCTVLYCTVLYCTVLYCAVLCCAVLCCAVLCCAVLYCMHACWSIFCLLQMEAAGDGDKAELIVDCTDCPLPSLVDLKAELNIFKYVMSTSGVGQRLCLLYTHKHNLAYRLEHPGPQR